MDIAVVIPTWNGAARIVPALESLAQQTLARDRFEVVVADDGSKDRTEEVVGDFRSRHPDLNLRYVRIPHGGVNAARNAGIGASAGRSVMLLDDDEEAPADHLERVVELMADRPDLPGVGGPYYLKDPAYRTCDRCRIGEQSLPISGGGLTPRLFGGNMVVRRELFDEVGLFDADISGRGDETEWFHRSSREFWYDEDLFVWHRRDHLSVPALLATGFRQGRSVPLAARRMGDSEWRPSPRKLARYLGHGLSKRCVRGFLQAARELGSTAAWVGMRLTGRKAGIAGPKGEP